MTATPSSTPPPPPDVAAAVATIERRPAQMDAAWTVGEWLLGAGKQSAAVDLLRNLARAAGATGDVGLAAAAALRCGSDADQLLTELAALYGAGSQRIARKRAPPPLRKEIERSLAPAGTAQPVTTERVLDAAARAAQALEAVRAAAARDAIPAVPLLSTLRPATLEVLLGAMEPVSLSPNQALIERGQPADALYLLALGSLRVSRESADGVSTLLARVRPGAWVGELALVAGTTRSADVHAEVPALVLRLGREHVERLAKSNAGFADELVEFAHRRMIDALIATSPVLCRMPAVARQRMLERFRVRTYERGGEILREGDEGEGLFLIASGEVALTTAKDGPLGTLGPGSVFGEASLLLRRPANATVTAAEPAIVLVLERGDFFLSMRERPQLMVELYDLAVARLDAHVTVVAAVPASKASPKGDDGADGDPETPLL